MKDQTQHYLKMKGYYDNRPKPKRIAPKDTILGKHLLDEFPQAKSFNIFQ